MQAVPQPFNRIRRTGQPRSETFRRCSTDAFRQSRGGAPCCQVPANAAFETVASFPLAACHSRVPTYEMINFLAATRRKAFYAILGVSMCLGSSGPLLRAEDGGVEADLEFRAYCAADFLLERPVGLSLTVTGFVTFMATLPFSALGGNTAEAARKLITRPFRYTFLRPLGHFEN